MIRNIFFTDFSKIFNEFDIFKNSSVDEFFLETFDSWPISVSIILNLLFI